MAVVIKTRFPLETCPDCNSEHMGGPCGSSSAAERYRTVRLGTEWMPAKQVDRQSGAKEYYDDSALSDLFDDGLTGRERKEELMDDTQGVGFASAAEVAQNPDLATQFYLDDTTDTIGET